MVPGSAAPLALAIAGGIIRELGHDQWQSSLLPLLREELGQELSMEEAVVNAFLHSVGSEARAGVRTK